MRFLRSFKHGTEFKHASERNFPNESELPFVSAEIRVGSRLSLTYEKSAATKNLEPDQCTV